MKTLSSSLGASASIPWRWAAAARRTMPGPASTRYAVPFTTTAAAGALGAAGAWASAPLVRVAASAAALAPANRRGTSDHDVQQPALHEDHLLRLAGNEPRDRWGLPCGRQRFLLRHVWPHANCAAHLALHLHGEVDELIPRELRVIPGPARVEHALGVTELLPQLLRQVRRERRDELHERLELVAMRRALALTDDVDVR